MTPGHEQEPVLAGELASSRAARRELSVPWDVFAGAQDCALLLESGDEASAIEQVNEAFVVLSGYSRRDVVGRDVTGLFAEAIDRELVRSLWDQFDRTPMRAEVSLRSASGIAMPVEVEVIPLVDPDGRSCLMILRDQSERRNAITSAERADQRLRLASDVGRIGTWEWNPATGDLSWDRWLRSILGVSDSETASHARWTELMNPQDRERAAADAQFLLAGMLDEVEARYRISRPDGTSRQVLARTRVSERATDGVATCLIGVLLDITELHQAAEEREILLAAEQRARATAEQASRELARLASSDPLTGLANRHELSRWITHALTRRDRIAVMFFDIDRFKPVNDSHGHNIGDHVLTELARRLRARIREVDLVARFGGDEFIVATTVADETETNQLARRLLDDIAKPIIAAGLQLELTASVGLVLSDQHHQSDPDALLRDADVALYNAKNQGRNRAVWYHSSQRALIV